MKTGQKKYWLRAFDRYLRSKFDLDSDKALPCEVVENISQGDEFRDTDLWMLIFAAFIASVGLSVNSAAVIVGAFYLFFINAVFIAFATFFIVRCSMAFIMVDIIDRVSLSRAEVCLIKPIFSGKGIDKDKLTKWLRVRARSPKVEILCRIA